MDLPPKKPFHIYQCAFDEFLRDLKENSLGPACVAFVCEDLNGETHAYVDGPEDKLKGLLKLLTKAIKEKKNAKSKS